MLTYFVSLLEAIYYHHHLVKSCSIQPLAGADPKRNLCSVSQCTDGALWAVFAGKFVGVDITEK